jgi:hypothetical protein
LSVRGAGKAGWIAENTGLEKEELMTKNRGLTAGSGRIALGLVTALVFLQCSPLLKAGTIFFSGDLRTDATVLDCGSGCTLGPSNTDGDYAQWAAVVDTFVVTTGTNMQAITYSYGGGTSMTGAIVPAGGLEPYLSLFDASGDFLASTFSGTTCPPGANTVGGNCFDVSLDGGFLTPGTYQIALTAFENMSLAENNGPPLLLTDGFTGFGNLAAGESLNYAFDVILDDGSSPGVPEPAAYWLLAPALGLFYFARNFRKGRSI